MPTKTISVNQDVLADRRAAAEVQRREWTEQGTLVVNLVSSPGAGKTSLLQSMARYWNGRVRMGVLVGDLATDRDAERLRPFVPVEQLTTGGACHLELSLVQHGLQKLPHQQYQILIIENVGNLVCPASHDLGEHLRIVALSSTEGDDKPGKYPKMFRTSQVMVITKSDLLPYVPFRVEAAVEDAQQIQPALRSFVTCAISGNGVEQLCDYLEHYRMQHLSPVHQRGEVVDGRVS